MSEPDAVQQQRNLRVSDAEREHVVGLLQKAIGRGMLNLDEFTERTDIALAARTRGELNAVLVDLPGLVHPDAVPSTRAEATPGVRGDRAELRAHGSSLVRKGHWFVPPELLVRNKYGSTKLDFSDAQVSSQTVHIELDVSWGSVSMVFPEQAAVDLNGLTELKWSSVDDKTNSKGGTGSPRFVITGRVHGSSLTVRHTRKGWFA